MERLDQTIERIRCSDPYGHRPAGPTHEASRRVFGRRRAVARGLLTATFAGNVPDYDIVATGSRGQTALVQVKAIAGPSWQFDIRTFTDVRYKAGAQTMGQPTTPPAGDLICVFVRLNKDGYGADRFYVLRWPGASGRLPGSLRPRPRDRVDLHDFWHARHLSNLPRPYTKADSTCT